MVSSLFSRLLTDNGISQTALVPLIGKHGRSKHFLSQALNYSTIRNISGDSNLINIFYRFKNLPRSSSLKQTCLCSIVLMASCPHVIMTSCDAFYRFLYVDAGTTGRWSDGGTYDQCSLALDAGTLHVPAEADLSCTETVWFVSICI